MFLSFASHKRLKSNDENIYVASSRRFAKKIRENGVGWVMVRYGVVFVRHRLRRGLVYFHVSVSILAAAAAADDVTTSSSKSQETKRDRNRNEKEMASGAGMSCA